MIPAPGTHAPLLPAGKLALKYLFTALLVDGTVYEQMPEDASPFTPGKNAFYELLESIGGEPILDNGKLVTRSDIAVFQLENGEHRWVVDLRDGHFEIQSLIDGEIRGAHLWLGFPPPGAQPKLFYHKIRRHHIKVSGTVQDDLTIKPGSIGEQSQECEYHFGWEAGGVRAEMILT